MTNKKEFCPHCGQAVMKHRQSLTPKMIETFLRVSTFPFDFHLQKDLNLTKNEYNNFQKLHYWKIVQQGEKAGYWRITALGHQFLAGEKLPKVVWTFNNKVVAQGIDLFTLEQLKQGKKNFLKKPYYVEHMQPAI